MAQNSTGAACRRASCGRLETSATQPTAAPRQAALLETLRRLGATARTRFGLAAALVGPATLARQLCPEQPLEDGLRRIKNAYMAVAEAMLQARPDLLLLTERMPAPDAEPERAWQRFFGTVRNLAAHYDVPLGATRRELGRRTVWLVREPEAAGAAVRRGLR